MNQFEMFQAILDFANENQLYDRFDDLELEWNEIVKKNKAWKSKVEKIYNELKKEGLIHEG